MVKYLIFVVAKMLKELNSILCDKYGLIMEEWVKKRVKELINRGVEKRKIKWEELKEVFEE